MNTILRIGGAWVIGSLVWGAAKRAMPSDTDQTTLMMGDIAAFAGAYWLLGKVIK